MKINSQNYYQFANQVGIDKLLPGLKKMHEVIDKVTKGGEDWSMYNTYRDRFDKQFEALEMFIDETSKPKAEKVETQPHQKKEHTSKEVKPYKIYKPVKSSGGGNQRGKKSKKEKRFEKPKVNGKGVELISPEVSFIRRFVLLHNKTKTKEQIVGFIRALQKAIVERRIRKAAKHSKVIVEIQKQLVSVYRKMGKEITLSFDNKDLMRYYKIAGAEIVMPSIRFIKAFVGMQGKEVTKHKVSNLHSRLIKALNTEVIKPSDKYYKDVRFVLNSLKDYLNSDKGDTIKISERELNGLEGVLRDCGCQNLKGFEYEEVEEEVTTETEKDDGVMSVEEARNAKFRPVELTGDWLRLIGKMCLPTHFLVYGLGGSGKTSFVLLFTQYLASIGYKILYVAREQYNTPTFTELLNRLNIVVGDNFKIVMDLEVLNPKDFNFVVLDSKDDMDIQLHQFKELKTQYPNQSFIAISQGTKTGDFTGKGQWRNAVDVMIHAQNGVIKTGTDKNRWGGVGEMKLM